MKLDDAIRIVKQLQRFRYRNCITRHPRGAFLRNALITRATPSELKQAIDAQKNPMGKMVWIEIIDLRTRQQCLAYGRLLRQLRRYPLKKVPIVVKLATGRYYLWDGNHRATSGILLGKRRIKCLQVGQTNPRLA
jgi:hypothetical protein